MKETSEQKDLRIESEIAQVTAKAIYEKAEKEAVEVICATGFRENKAVRLNKLAEICQAPRPHLLAVEVSFEEACKEEQSATEPRQMTAVELMSGLRHWWSDERLEGRNPFGWDVMKKAESLIQKQKGEE